MLQPTSGLPSVAEVANALHDVYPRIIRRRGESLQQQDVAQTVTLLISALETAFQRRGDCQVQLFRT